MSEQLMREVLEEMKRSASHYAETSNNARTIENKAYYLGVARGYEAAIVKVETALLQTVAGVGI